MEECRQGPVNVRCLPAIMAMAANQRCSAIQTTAFVRVAGIKFTGGWFDRSRGEPCSDRVSQYL